ncbi:hypothetical protein ACIQNG_12015 [Streptomyces sp. NPDC091377]|uniref:hypothetical protein n=1 Tax=unclassified Streptomyces TaxID=2593676 RepID=UPI003827AD0E
MNTTPGPAASLSDRLRGVNRTLVGVLSAVALIRPLFSIVGLSDALGKPAAPLLLTAGVSLTWILVVGLRRDREPLLTLIAAGVGYALATIVLSAILSPLLTGELQGPLAKPYAIVPLLLVNILWGAACGGLALALRALRNRGR